MNRALPWMAFALAFGIGSCGFSRQERPVKTKEELIVIRKARDEAAGQQAEQLFRRCVENVKRRRDATPTGADAAIDVLIISGGGDWGAFGVGVLKGWGRVKGTGRRPDFDVVTGVSTGALIAPFAFLGDDKSLDTIDHLYRHPDKGWIDERSWISILSASPSFATIPGIENETARIVDIDMLRAIADKSQSGRILVVSTTNVDLAEVRMWDLADEATKCVKSGNAERVHTILLASAAIPGIFPPRELDGELFVDGGVTGNIVYGVRSVNDDPFVHTWGRLYEDSPPPKVRYWVLFNNQVRPAPETVQPIWVDVAMRSLTMTTRTATVSALRHLFAKAEIARLVHGAAIEVRYMAVPDDWVPPNEKSFDATTMNALADLGETMGADPSKWVDKCP